MNLIITNFKTVLLPYDLLRKPCVPCSSPSSVLTLCIWLMTSVCEELCSGLPLISRISSATCRGGRTSHLFIHLLGLVFTAINLYRYHVVWTGQITKKLGQCNHCKNSKSLEKFMRKSWESPEKVLRKS